jgi:hypothetical protein
VRIRNTAWYCCIPYCVYSFLSNSVGTYTYLSAWGGICRVRYIYVFHAVRTLKKYGYHFPNWCPPQKIEIPHIFKKNQPKHWGSFICTFHWSAQTCLHSQKEKFILIIFFNTAVSFQTCTWFMFCKISDQRPEAGILPRTRPPSLPYGEGLLLSSLLEFTKLAKKLPASQCTDFCKLGISSLN